MTAMQPAPEAQKVPSHDLRLQNPTVLVVEDEPMMRELLMEFLESSGFAVLEAANADEAMRQIEYHSEIDLVFSDVRMPGSMDGVALAQWLHEVHPDVQILLTSGYAGEVHFGKALYGEKFLPKPYSLDTLAKKIHDRLGPSAH